MRSSFDSNLDTSTSLIARAQASDALAWERISELYGPLVYGWARRAGLAPDDASDVMQDVFQSITRSLTHFRRDRPGDSFRGWLWTICRNKTRDLQRRANKDGLAIGGSDALHMFQSIRDEPATRDEDSSRELSGLRRRALQMIRRDYDNRSWQAFWRSAVEGDTPGRCGR